MYENINEKRLEIIELWKNKEYDKISKLINCHNSFSNCSASLLKYCEQYNDRELTEIIFSTDDGIKLGYEWLRWIVKNNYPEIFEKLLIGNIPGNFSSIWLTIINSDDYVIYIEILSKLNIEISNNYITIAVTYDKINVIKYLIENNYNVQEAIDNIKYETNMSQTMIKLLYHNNIDLSKSLYWIFHGCIGVVVNNLDPIKLLIEIYQNYDINILLRYTCSHNDIMIIKYLLEIGANINIIDNECLEYTNIETIKFLHQHGLVIDELVLNDKLFINVNDGNFDNVIWLIEHGANMEFVLNGQKSINYPTKSIEYPATDNLVLNDNLKMLKFLAENYYHLLQPEITRLLIVACANGRCKIMKYLFGLGANLDNRALIAACFFGHMDVVNLLLSWGMDFKNIDDDLFEVIHDGYRYINHSSSTYTKLITSDPILKCHYYYYGSDYIDILKLLINHNVPICDTKLLFNSELLLDIDFIKYSMEMGLDINVKIEGYVGYDNLFTYSIHMCKWHVAEFLLKCGIEVCPLSYTNEKNISILEPLKKLLLDYGYESQWNLF
jgi:ankyrin repeat protein